MRAGLILFGLLGLLYFVGLGRRPLSNPDEGRYVEIAREMAVSGDYISPRLNGVLYFEKPPLFYWLESGAVAVGGENLWALRFWPAALALLGCAAVFGTARSIWGLGSAAAIILGTSVLYFALGQIIILDMAVSVFITWALCAFLLAVRAPPGPRRRWLSYAFYASMALALLTKGLIGVVIPGAIIVLWLALLNRWRELRHAYFLGAVVILGVLGLPWHIAAALAHPSPDGGGWAHFFSRNTHNQGFLWYYFWHEHVLRYVDPSTANRVQPWWFFPVILTAGFLPWTFFLPSALRSFCQGGWSRMKTQPEILFLCLWALVPLAFFSVSSSKLVPYILPSVPPLALLAAWFITRSARESGGRPLLWPLRALGGFAVAGAFGLAGYAMWAGALPVPGRWFYAFAALLLAGGSLLLMYTARARPNLIRAAFVLMITIVFSLGSLNALATELIDVRRPSTAPAAAWLRPRLQPGDQVFVLGDYGPYQDFPALLGRTIGVAGHVPDEQEFGLMLETDKLAARYPGLVEYLRLRNLPGTTSTQISDAQMAAFLDVLRQPARVYVLVAAKQFEEFISTHPDAPAHLVWRDGHFVLFSNQTAPPPT